MKIIRRSTVNAATKYFADMVSCADEVEVEDYDLPEAHQNYSSKNTAVNSLSGRLPAIFKKVKFPKGALVLDYGGGRPEAEAIANQELAKYEATDLVYDEYWTSPERKAEIRKILKQNGGADVAICSNVLNVIDTYEGRINALKRIRMMTKPGAPVYIYIHEGSGSGQGKQTGEDKYQLNRETSAYLTEIQEVFPDARYKAKHFIVATNSGAVTAATVPSPYDNIPTDDNWIELPAENVDITVFVDTDIEVDETGDMTFPDVFWEEVEGNETDYMDEVIDEDELYERSAQILVDEIGDIIDAEYGPGSYHVSAIIGIRYQVDGVIYTEDEWGREYVADNASVDYLPGYDSITDIEITKN